MLGDAPWIPGHLARGLVPATGALGCSDEGGAGGTQSPCPSSFPLPPLGHPRCRSSSAPSSDLGVGWQSQASLGPQGKRLEDSPEQEGGWKVNPIGALEKRRVERPRFESGFELPSLHHPEQGGVLILPANAPPADFL